LQEQAGKQVVIPFSADPTATPIALEKVEVRIDELLRLYEIDAERRQNPELKGKTINEKSRKRNVSQLTNYCSRHGISTYQELVDFQKKYTPAIEEEARRDNNEKAVKVGKGFPAMLRCCGSVFSEDALKFYDENLSIKIANPFQKYSTNQKSKKYRPPPDGDLFWQQLHRLIMCLNDPLVILLYLICRYTGTRLQEATHLTWGNLVTLRRGESYLLEINSDELHSTKGYESREVPIPPFVFDYLQSHRPPSASDDDWIFPYERTPKLPSDGERGYGVASRLRKWLKSNGWNRTNPIHELRKAYGADIATEFGIYTASEYLGHCDIKVTRKTYARSLKHGTIKRPLYLKCDHNEHISPNTIDSEAPELQGTPSTPFDPEPPVAPIAMVPKTSPALAVATPLSHKLLKATHAILEDLKMHASRSPRDLEVQLGLSKSTRKRAITALLEDGLIRGHGTTRSTQYFLSPLKNKPKEYNEK
jgi:integrase